MLRTGIFSCIACLGLLAFPALADVKSDGEQIIDAMQDRGCRLTFEDYQTSIVPGLSDDSFHAALEALQQSQKLHLDGVDMVLDSALCADGATAAAETAPSALVAESNGIAGELGEFMAELAGGVPGSADAAPEEPAPEETVAEEPAPEGTAPKETAPAEAPGSSPAADLPAVEDHSAMDAGEDKTSGLEEIDWMESSTKGDAEFMQRCEAVAKRLDSLAGLIESNEVIKVFEDQDLFPYLMALEMAYSDSKQTSRFLRRAEISDALMELSTECIEPGPECQAVKDDLQFTPETVDEDLLEACRKDYEGA